MPVDGPRKLAILRSVYLLIVGAAGLAAIAVTLPETLKQAAAGAGLLGLGVFLAMSVLSEWANVPMARGALTLSYAVVLPTFILYGPGGAALVEVVGYLIGTARETRGWRVKLFNCGQYSLTVFIASAVFHLVGGVRAAELDTVGILTLLIFTAVYFAVNHAFVGLWFTLTHPEESVRIIWGDPAKWEGLTYLITAPLGVTVIMLYSVGGLIGAIALFVVSFVAAFVFRLAFRLDSLNHELRTLYEAAGALGQGLDLDAVKEKVFNILKRLALSDLVALFLWDDVGQVLRAEGGYPGGNALQGQSFRVGQGVIGEVARKRIVEVVPDVAADARFEAERYWQPPTSLVLAPMATEESLIGVLVLGSNQAGTYTEEHIRLLTIFAGQAGAALSRALRYQETRRMAITDAKTGVYNYRFFYERLLDEIRHSAAKSRPFALIFVDIDYLKGVNDRFGHQVGDEVLIQVASIIKGNVRTTDEVARYGGEEFVVLLPGATGEEALAAAERIRRTVEGRDFAPSRGPAHVTITAGVATYPEHATQPDELIFRADEAMYHGKHCGRNRVSLYAPAPIPPDLGPA
jgi:two-component system cell cycle response regulator